MKEISKKTNRRFLMQRESVIARVWHAIYSKKRFTHYRASSGKIVMV